MAGNYLLRRNLQRKSRRFHFLFSREENDVKAKMKVKMFIDLLMTVFLLMLMAYQITGEKLHEWLGAGMVVLFLIHNLLNLSWYGHLLKGKYTVLRIIRTVINFSVLAAMLALAYSGIVMSRHVFSVLPLNGGMATARVLHLAGSYWAFVLMSVHLGLHLGMVISMFRKFFGGKKSVVFLWILRLITILIAVYGAVCFYQADILSYMFVKVEFAFLDYEKNAVLIFAEYMAMMGLWVFIAYYVSKALGRLSTSKSKRKEKGNEKN